jgi:outer membrane usher protein
VVEYAKDRSGPDDPLQYDAKLAAGKGQDQRLFVSDQTSAFTASLRVQQLNGMNLFEPEMSGALAVAAGHLFALHEVSESQTFGVVHVPGVSDVPVSVNGQPGGTTDRNGNLLLRDLAPFRQNVVTVSAAGLPLGTTIVDPKTVTPFEFSPVSLTIPVLGRGAFIVHVDDASGKPIGPATMLRGGGRDYPVGYDGRVYVWGIGGGPQQFTGTTVDGRPCTVTIDVLLDTTTVPDLGTAVCH